MEGQHQEIVPAPPHFAFHGSIVSKDREKTVVRLFPGLSLDVRTDDIAELEEIEDTVTRRSFVRVKLRPDADVAANFQPRLARMALEARGDVPFAYGGTSTVERPHAMPSGGAQPIVPGVDLSAVQAFEGRLPPHAWGELVNRLGGDVMLAKSTSSNTSSTTNKQTSHATVSDTAVDIDGSIMHTPDSGDDPSNDPVTDTTPDTSNDFY